MVLRREKPQEPVHERGERGVELIAAIDFPYSNLVVLVCSDELLVEKGYRFNGGLTNGRDGGGA